MSNLYALFMNLKQVQKTKRKGKEEEKRCKRNPV